MKAPNPRHPIIVIGAGIAGLAAAMRLTALDVPHLVLERFDTPGGRMNSRTGTGYIADHGCPYFTKNDITMVELVRNVGLEERRVTISGGIHTLNADGSITVPKNGGLDASRVCIDTGFRSFADALAAAVSVRYGSAVGAIKWDNSTKAFWWDDEGQVFWFEDSTGEPIRDEVTRKPLLASGVILATTGTAATAIVEKSKSLHDLLPPLKTVRYTSSFTAVFRTPRLKRDFFALQGAAGSNIGWLSLEERKAPERVAADQSLLVVQGSEVWSAHLGAMGEHEAVAEMWKEVRRVLPELPEKPLSQMHKKWNVSQLKSAPLGIPTTGRHATNPEHAPFMLAGDYVLGPRLEDAARSGWLAAEAIVKQLPARRTFLGLELQA